ncbi:hypothetical protein Tco_1335316 [Tanacetum coccineum]
MIVIEKFLKSCAHTLDDLITKYKKASYIRVLLPRHGTRDSKPDLSFDIPASPECMSGFAHASSSEVISYISPSEFRGRLYLIMSPPPPQSSANATKSFMLDFLNWHSHSCVFGNLPLGGYDRNDVERLCVYLTRLREMKEAVLVRSELSFVWSNQKCDPVFRRTSDNSGRLRGLCFCLVFSTSILERVQNNTTIPTAEGTPVPLPTPDEVDVAQPNLVLVNKSKAPVKRKASTSLVVPSGPDQPSKVVLSFSMIGKRLAISLLAPCILMILLFGHSVAAIASLLGIALFRKVSLLLVLLERLGHSYASVVGSSRYVSSSVCSLDHVDGPHALEDNVSCNEIFKDPDVCRRALDRTITPAELKKTESLLLLELLNRMSVLTTLLTSHGTEMNSRYTSLVASKVRSREKLKRKIPSLGDVSFEEFRKLKVQLVEAIAAVARSSDELAQTDAKLSDQALVVRNLQNYLALVKSKSQEYKDAAVIAERRFDGLKYEVTHFVSSGVECLIRRLLSSDEFNFAFARVLYLGITSGVERGLRMGRTDVAFEEAAQNVSNFFVGAQAEFDKAVTAFPSTNFPFLSKVVVAVGVSEVVNIQPDKIVRSATPAFVLAATLYSNEAFNRTSTPEEPEHALDVSSSLV